MTSSNFFLVVAGPNGAGKSTLTSQGIEGLPIIDPDAIARDIAPHAPESAGIPAGKKALRQAKGFIAQKRSFIQETTLSGRSTLRMMERARKMNMGIILVYIGLDSPALSLARIFGRVQAGGHNIPPEDAKRRYYRSLQNLPNAAAIADRTIILDNSSAYPPYKPILELTCGKITQELSSPPHWLPAL